MRMRDIINEIAADTVWDDNRREIVKGILALIKEKKFNAAVRQYESYKDLYPAWPAWRMIHQALVSLHLKSRNRENNRLTEPKSITSGLLGHDK